MHNRYLEVVYLFKTSCVQVYTQTSTLLIGFGNTF